MAATYVSYWKEVFFLDFLGMGVGEAVLDFHFISPIEILPSTPFDFFIIQICNIYVWLYSVTSLKIRLSKGEDKDVIMSQYRKTCMITVITVFSALIFLVNNSTGSMHWYDLLFLFPAFTVMVKLFFYKKNESIMGECDRSNVTSVIASIKKSHSLEGFGEYGFYAGALRVITFNQLALYVIYHIYNSSIILQLITINTSIVSILGFILINREIEKSKFFNGSRIFTFTTFSICSLIYVVYISGVLNDIYSVSSEYFQNTIVMMSFVGFSMIFNHVISIQLFSMIIVSALIYHMLRTTKVKEVFKDISKVSSKELDAIIVHLCVILFVVISALNSKTYSQNMNKIAIFSSYLTDFEKANPCGNFSLLDYQKAIELKNGDFFIFDIEKEISFIKECRRKEVIEINKG